ncbi:hypothetical protein AVEN_178512-1 [Araneus ventricosus]|uniref:Uncharacterized protein n=1 Tax=Araneus ventricosus TaxID=182803 RepID=A0A4Y2CGX4_ARAVE|nr:hypothetical protein AVEN_178512-1 [Araneus ventricosus]
MLKDRLKNSIMLFFKRFVQGRRESGMGIKENTNELRYSDSNPEEAYANILKDFRIANLVLTVESYSSSKGLYRVAAKESASYVLNLVTIDIEPASHPELPLNWGQSFNGSRCSISEGQSRQNQMPCSTPSGEYSKDRGNKARKKYSYDCDKKTLPRARPWINPTCRKFSTIFMRYFMLCGIQNSAATLWRYREISCVIREQNEVQKLMVCRQPAIKMGVAYSKLALSSISVQSLIVHRELGTILHAVATDYEWSSCYPRRVIDNLQLCC